MAGSRHDTLYTTDKGVQYYLNVDKSNWSAANGSFGIAGVDVDAVPRNIRPRYALYRSEDRKYSVKVAIGTLAKFADLPPTITNYAGIECKLINRVPEKRRAASSVDTGLTV